MSGVVDVRCGGCLVWWMSYFTHGVVDVWCGGCLCGGCRTITFSDTKPTSFTLLVTDNTDVNICNCESYFEDMD